MFQLSNECIERHCIEKNVKNGALDAMDYLHNHSFSNNFPNITPFTIYFVLLRTSYSIVNFLHDKSEFSLRYVKMGNSSLSPSYTWSSGTNRMELYYSLSRYYCRLSRISVIILDSGGNEDKTFQHYMFDTFWSQCNHSVAARPNSLKLM